ncbi:MAG: DUF4349 domain-containing protein, partial [Candidatus Pacebacteria bacterium]|nr:DUF4349 domain-containing protein [Candidatus Paceibacterota bacterium]
VDSNLTKPEEAASGTIRVRVNSAKLDQFLSETKELGVKVVSQYTSGQDITEQYEDLDERLRILEQTKSKFEAILSSATEVDDMLQVQRELLQIQRQIDNLKGRKEALQKRVDLSLVTVHLATDELALPYAPDQSWRPNLVFKNAVRSLVRTSRGMVNLAIWLVVYAPYWLGAIVIFVVIRKLSQELPKNN